MTEIETFCAGSPLEYTIEGVSQLSSKQLRAHNNIANPIGEEYGIDVTESTADVIQRLYGAVDGLALVEAVKKTGLDELDEYETVLSGCDLDDDEEANLGKVMAVLDQKISYCLAPREKDADKVSKKRQRETAYVPNLINDLGEGGTIYMAKSLTTTAKVRMAWDLHDENQVIVVDDYDKWENLLGWEKLKQFPHGKNKIREEYGDQLSDEVLDIVAGTDDSDTDTKADADDSSSRGRRTRTKPTDEILNIAISSRHKSRQKLKAEDIKEQFEDSDRDYIGSEWKNVQMLVLFPSTAEQNLSDHYWIAGDRWDGAGKVAITNCNKGTFEYLADCEEVWHIEDYLSQAEDYEFESNHGPVTLGTIDTDNLVMQVVSQDSRTRLMRDTVIENMPNVLPDYCEDELYRPPEFPHTDDMLYAPVTQEDVFWMRPALKEMDNSVDEGATILYAGHKPRNICKSWNVSSDYKLYARARLPDWDFDSTELETLDGCGYALSLDDGGYELVETLAKLHDNGMQPFSETPQARWSQ